MKKFKNYLVDRNRQLLQLADHQPGNTECLFQMMDKWQCVENIHKEDMYRGGKEVHNHLGHPDHVLINIRDMDSILNSALDIHNLFHVVGNKDFIIRDLNKTCVSFVQERLLHTGQQACMQNSQNQICNECGGSRHANIMFCPAINKYCAYCQKLGHFEIACRTAQRDRMTE